MSFVEWLREREETRKRLFDEYLKHLRKESVTVILFGSRARGDQRKGSSDKQGWAGLPHY